MDKHVMGNYVDVVRVWEDEEYRNSLNPAQLAHLPQNPDGDGELSEEELERLTGGLDFRGFGSENIVPGNLPLLGGNKTRSWL
jgi:mersacidin/lichenicidin family type 2 lantibiotic